jgi:hypothetical protein
VPVFYRFVPPRARINHSEWALEPAGDHGQILAEAAFWITGVGNPDNKKVVALTGFISDRLWPG